MRFICCTHGPSDGPFTDGISAANAQMQQELHATSAQISLTLSLSILIQGNVPLLWSAMSEIKGRKVRSRCSIHIRGDTQILSQLVYLLATTLFTLGSVIVALSKNIGLVIAMRVIQAFGYACIPYWCDPLSECRFLQIKCHLYDWCCDIGRYI